MTQIQNINNNQQQIPMPPPPMPRQSVRNKGGWRQRLLNGNTRRQLTSLQERTIPNWLTGKSVVCFFLDMLLCWIIFGFVPDMDLVIVSCISVLIFFYGSISLSRQGAGLSEKQFIRNIFIVGLSFRLIWVLYCYFFFDPEYFGNTYGETADVDWYMPFGKAIYEWIIGESELTFQQIIDSWDSAIDDVGYPLWLAIIHLITFGESDVFAPFFVKCLVSSYCSVCIYHVARRHYGEGVARMAAIFVAFNPNVIYWCGSMMKEAEMVFLCCIFVDETDKALSSDKYSFKALLPGLLAGLSLFFFRAALGVSSFLAVFAHVVFASNRVLSYGKKIIAGILVALTLVIGMGDSLRTKTEKMFETAQSTETQERNMKWRAERKDGNKFAEYAGAAVFAPLIFTIPFPTFNAAQSGHYLQIQLSGGYFIKNIFSFFVIWVMITMLLSGEWRRHVFILAYTCSYLSVLVMSSFAQSGRFHMPIWPMLMLFAAYGIQIAKSKPRMRRVFTLVLILEVVACVAWNWFKLAGRGLV